MGGTRHSEPETADIPALLAQLVPVRQALNADIATLMEAPSWSRFGDRRQNTLRAFKQRYVPTLAPLAGYPAAELVRWRDELVTRLERGWELAGDAVTATVVRVVAELEVVEDAIVGVDEARRRYVERIERIQAVRWAHADVRVS